MTKTKANYERACEVCDQVPTVDIHYEDEKLEHSNLCGACFFGEADMIDPANWDEE